MSQRHTPDFLVLSNPGVLCYREGRFHHFVEIDLDGNLIRSV